MNEITQIVECFLPNLVAGEYTVVVNQDIKKDNTAIQNITQELKFGIDAARFTLNSDDVYSVYPPADTTGQYNNHFPHIVFNRRSLPWERTINGKPRETVKTKNGEQEKIVAVPWMALLLLDEDEIKTLKIETRELNDILTPKEPTVPTDKISRPKIWDKDYKNEGLKLMDWEDIKQKCLTIDITKEQFEQYIPTLEEQVFLAHSKITAITHKDNNGIGDIVGGEGYFSVLMSKRFICKNKTFTAVVVSLEGHQEYIENHSKIEDKVRMVVLASWKFNNNGETTFKSLLDNIEVHNMALNHTLKKNKNLEIKNSTEDPLKEYIKYGYVPMRHLMRNGAKNISWYRGPFVPHQVTFENVDYISFSSSDTALYYDTNTGLLDTSIAAAWELGKILALKNQEFTKAMVEWNNNPIIEKSKKVDTTKVSKETVIAWLENTILESEKTENSKLESYKPFPDIVKSFLEALAKLQGIPLSYLIPDKKYIFNANGNADALTFFYINPFWIYALLDGAVSLTNYNLLDTKTQIKGIIDSVYGTQKCTGFLLNSKLVSGWRGIEIKAFKEDKTLLDNPIRFERITPSIFLGIFKDPINSIAIKQPYEGLHFGVKENKKDKTKFEKEVKDKTKFEKEEKDNNSAISDNNRIEISEKNQVIAVTDLIEKLKEKTKSENLTTAEFAYQMIDSPLEATFNFIFNKEIPSKP